MSDSTQQGQQGSGAPIATGVFVPPAVQDSHGPLVDLVLKSESMNDEERQYWIDILPVMTTEQIEQLRIILVNERDQLAAIDEKYSKSGTQEVPQVRPVTDIENERRDRAHKRSTVEVEAEAEETRKEAEILKQVEDV